MSTNVRKALGPVRKRLRDRIEEVEATLKTTGITTTYLKSVKTKLIANIDCHEKICDKLTSLCNLEEDDAAVVGSEIEISVELNLDANEALQTLIECINDLELGDAKTSDNAKHKEELEIEKLKLEKELEKISSAEDTKSNVANLNVSAQKIRLPEIPLPTFSGKIIEWPSFWDSFNSTIHLNINVSKIDKFKYLMSQLEGDARSTLRGFELTGEQYDEAVALLKERYDDSEYIIHHHYKVLTQLPKSSNDTCDLRKTINLMESQIRALQCMGEQVENNYMVSLFKSKLPESVNLRLEETREQKWTLSSLRKLTNRLVIAREKSEGVMENQLDDKEFQFSGEGLLANNSKIKCCFCEKSHWSDECQQFRTVDERKIKLRGKCFICLSSSHLYRHCNSKKPCYYCKEVGSHHSSLCIRQFGNTGYTISREPVVFGEELDVNLSRDVVMKTAKVVVYNPESSRCRTIVALMDSGAKRSYLTKQIADLLNLEFGPSKVTTLNTFSTNSTSHMVTSASRIAIKQKYGENKIMEVNVCQTITGSMIRQKLDVEQFRDIWGQLDMADDIPRKFTRFNIDLLIGNDYYDDFMKAEKIQLSNGLYMINSIFGWMFSGRIMSHNYSHNAEISMLAEEIDVAKKAWELETIGIQHVSDDEELEQYIGEYRSKLNKVSNRYSVGLTWKLSKYELSDNYNMAKARLKSVLNSIIRDPDKDLLNKYDAIIKRQLKEGITEEVINERQKLHENNNVIHYMPHHLVKTANKLRIVFDGSAKTNDAKKILNDCLFKGSNTVTNLCGVLLRFCLNPIALRL